VNNAHLVGFGVAHVKGCFSDVVIQG